MSRLRGSGWVARTCLALFAIAWTAFSMLWVGGAWLTGAPWFSMLFGLLFIAVGIGLLAWALVPALVRMKLAPPEVVLSPQEVRVGDRLSFSYRQEFKRPVDINAISVQFVFRETATYQQGTDTVTVTHEVPIESWTYPAMHYEAGQTFQDSRTLEIPEDGMHTFIAQDNKLQWIIKLHVDIAGWPDFREEYEVHVLPERRR